MEAQKQGLMCIVQRRIIKQALLGLEWTFVSFFHSWSFFFLTGPARFARSPQPAPPESERAAGANQTRRTRFLHERLRNQFKSCVS